MNWIENLDNTTLENLTLSEDRKSALASFKTLGLPTRQQEEWKYTNLSKFMKADWRFETNSNVEVEVPSKISENALQFVFVNGLFQADLSDAFPTNFEVTTLAQQSKLPEAFDKIAVKEGDSMLALNKALYRDGLFIHMKRNEVLEQRIELVFINNNTEATITNPRNFYIVEENAQVKITERHINQGSAEHFTNVLTEGDVAANGRLVICKIQNDTTESSIVDHTWIRQDKQTHAQVDTFSFDGKLVRNNLTFLHTGEHLESHLRAITIGTGKSHIDHSTLVDHAKPNGFSNQMYKGIYGDKSNGVFNGRIMVNPDAQKTNAFQQNNNILTSKTASLDTKPQLEIFADDVKCSHGCTIGQMDEKAIFFMQQRGIPKKEAIALLTFAFANEALENVTDEALNLHVRKMIASKLKVDIDLE